MNALQVNHDRPREACGVFGIYEHPEAAKITCFGLYALQHRGQESAGIAVARDNKIVTHNAMGLVSDIFKINHLEKLDGGSAIGHVRYSTTGSSTLSNTQPFAVNHMGRSYAIAHNGNLVNAHTLKKELENDGSIFQTTIDSEVVLHILIKNLKYGLKQAMLNMTARLRGACSFTILTGRGEVIGVKDPNGIRPLCLGKLNQHYVLASESCALDLLQADFIRELEPGEIIIATCPDDDMDENFCRACFDGCFPVTVDHGASKTCLE
ncbi:MAG: class II glutamine amidotransferase [Thermodesulfobacteriota bacterium]|nr:class II glutamine amidotransferase [Thermodesulfobacteriota bacterium]